MSDAGPSRAEASEETPLLQDDASTTTGTAPRDSNNDVEARRGATADERQASLARVDKVLKILFASTISTGIATLAFSIALFVLGQYGQERFGYYDDIASSYQWPFFWQIVLAIVLSGTNLARMSHRSRPLPALINMIIFVLSGFYILICTVDILTWTNALFGGLCRSDLDDPDPRWGRHYPGSLKECCYWEPKYQAVAWVWVCLELIMGLLMVTIAAACLVRVYKLRVQTGSDGEGQRTGSRWTIPAGQVSFEVSVYWGAPSARGEGRPRQVEDVDERHDA